MTKLNGAHPGSGQQRDYFGSVLSQFENGCQMGLRMKLALDILKSPQRLNIAPATPQEAVALALAMADELVTQSEERGYLIQIPEDDGINSSLRKHIRRSVRANLIQQIVANEIGPQESPSVIPANTPGMVRPPFA